MINFPIECSIKVSNEEKRQVIKHVIHDTLITLSPDDPFISSLKEKAIKEFNETPEDVVITFRITL